MKILFIGDVVGRSGRDALLQHLPNIKEKLQPDCVIVNVDNAAHGFGVTAKVAEEFLNSGIDCLTGGNHIWDQRDIIPFIAREPRLLRVANVPDTVPGQGVYVHTSAKGSVVIIHLMGRLFMDPLDDPFRVCDEILKKYQLGKNVSAIFVDMHAEATSEKMALAQYLDGRITALVGTHTHLPTADTQILTKGTGFQADAGMTGDYNSVIGMKSDVPMQRFARKFCVEKLSPAEGEATICGVFVESHPQTGLCDFIAPLRLGPRLNNVWPTKSPP
jgi:2',3'-cyclic-nucleotide 2'-phosphodiesterase